MFPSSSNPPVSHGCQSDTHSSVVEGRSGLGPSHDIDLLGVSREILQGNTLYRGSKDYIGIHFPYSLLSVR